MNAIPPTPPEEPAAERTARHLAMLRELAEIGMALARALGQQALAALAPPAAETPEPAPAPTPPSRIDPGLAFARIARVVRQIIALEARIIADRDAPPRPPRPDGRSDGRPGRRPDRSADPRHATIRRVLHEAARLDARGAAPAPCCAGSTSGSATNSTPTPTRTSRSRRSSPASAKTSASAATSPGCRTNCSTS